MINVPRNICPFRPAMTCRVDAEKPGAITAGSVISLYSQSGRCTAARSFSSFLLEMPVRSGEPLQETAAIPG